MLRKVVDSNYLKSPELRLYLEASKYNFALITDYTAMEAYKELSGENIFEAMKILSCFKDQVIILKNTIDVCGMIPFKKQNNSWLINKSETSGFGQFCDDLKKAKDGNLQFKEIIEGHKEAALLQMERITKDTPKFLGGMIGLEKHYSDKTIKSLRKGETWSEDLVKTVWDNSKVMALEMFNIHPSTKRLPNSLEMERTFIFYNCLSAQVHFLDWISRGSPSQVTDVKIRNDIIDNNFSAFALFFDGILTFDKNLLKTFNQAKAILEMKI